MYVQTNKPICVYTRVSVHITYPLANEKIKFHARESEGQGSLPSCAVLISYPLEPAPRGILCISAAFFLVSLADALHKLL